MVLALAAVIYMGVVPVESMEPPVDESSFGREDEDRLWGDDPLWDDDPLWQDDQFDYERSVADPLEPLNRLFFQFNDRMYFWVMSPVASRYAKVVPTDVRRSVANFFNNLQAPIRIVNNVLQLKPRETGIELSRFAINSTLGVAGFADPARKQFGLEPRDEDLGQTLGYWGLGDGFYIVWPFLGPSNVRDSFGRLGDSFLSPVDYLILHDPAWGLSVVAYKNVNSTSFRVSEYERFMEMAFDPYLAMRDAYQQYRRSLIEDRRQQLGEQPF
jgi:phospholipid-binding lipoprotein MlaA